MQERKKQEKQKDGVDFLIKQGYKKLSAKTFISDIDLERFLNKDFQNINKTRALGFIQILEREYDVDLSELKQAYLEHEHAHKPKEPDTLFVETPIKEEKVWQKYIPYIAGFLVVGGLTFYLFKPNNDAVENQELLTQQIEENKSIIDEAQKNLEKFEENKSRVAANSTLENTLTHTDKTNSSIATSNTSNDDDLDLDKVVLEMIKERNISIEEDQNITLNKNITVAKVEKQVKNQKIKPVVIKDEPKKQKTKNKKAINGQLYIEPTRKAWVGVIYLDNFTKKDFLIRSKLPLDPNRDQLIVIGHKYFKIFNKDYSVKFTGRGPVRFIYKDGELMEINKKEFVRTSAGVAW
jgi:hypothetical protein